MSTIGTLVRALRQRLREIGENLSSDSQQRLPDAPASPEWLEKVRLSRASEEFVTGVASKLSPDLQAHLKSLTQRDVYPLSLGALIKLVKASDESSTRSLLHDMITKDEYDTIQRLSPRILSELLALYADESAVHSGGKSSDKPGKPGVSE
ncbi:MAG TPA: hypothetical protein VGQ93_05980 [Lysobacter sp.]|jgi:hypothetical protein|nr:hypothetical protein [Lysobacter sp.]